MKRHLGGFGLVTLMIVVLAVPAGAQVVFTDVTEEVGIALTDQLIESGRALHRCHRRCRRGPFGLQCRHCVW
jgi:hypothetical protein